MITAETLVAREVHYCVSSLVHSLAQGYGGTNEELGAIAEQAFELACPINDWDSAAIDAGWKETPEGWTSIEPDAEGAEFFHSAQDLCETLGFEPYQREVYEHWIVSDWLADHLIKRGEKVDKDFCGLTVWARTTTGQAIASDYVIDDILRELGEA